jgi:hypothetical protein
VRNRKNYGKCKIDTPPGQKRNRGNHNTANGRLVGEIDDAEMMVEGGPDLLPVRMGKLGRLVPKMYCVGHARSWELALPREEFSCMIYLRCVSGVCTVFTASIPRFNFQGTLLYLGALSLYCTDSQMFQQPISSRTGLSCSFTSRHSKTGLPSARRRCGTSKTSPKRSAGAFPGRWVDMNTGRILIRSVMRPR